MAQLVVKLEHSLGIVIAAGGTGGHLYPAVALAREFLRNEPSSKILFVGTVRGIERKVLRHERLDLALITALPFMGLGVIKAMQAVALLPVGIWQALRLLRAHRANLVIGVGGYTTPPVLLAAALMRIPRVILEPNAYPGLANKVVAPLAHLIFLAFDSSVAAFDSKKVRMLGMPIRQAFLDESPKGKMTNEPQRPGLLIFGGSQGARALNDAVVEALPHLAHWQSRLTIVHQTGEADHDRVAQAYEDAGFEAEVVPFLFDMPKRLQTATLVISRSGAMTLAEVTACGKASLLIPLPHAIYNHQMRNAEVLEKAGAAILLPQTELTGERLAQTIDQLLSDTGRLQDMEEQSRKLGRREAAEHIVKECVALIQTR